MPGSSNRCGTRSVALRRWRREYVVCRGAPCIVCIFLLAISYHALISLYFPDRLSGVLGTSRSSYPTDHRVVQFEMCLQVVFFVQVNPRRCVYPCFDASYMKEKVAVKKVMDHGDRVGLPTGRTNARLLSRGQGLRCEDDDDKRCKGDRYLIRGSDKNAYHRFTRN